MLFYPRQRRPNNIDDTTKFTVPTVNTGLRVRPNEKRRTKDVATATVRVVASEIPAFHPGRDDAADERRLPVTRSPDPPKQEWPPTPPPSPPTRLLDAPAVRAERAAGRPVRPRSDNVGDTDPSGGQPVRDAPVLAQRPVRTELDRRHRRAAAIQTVQVGAGGRRPAGVNVTKSMAKSS